MVAVFFVKFFLIFPKYMLLFKQLHQFRVNKPFDPNIIKSRIHDIVDYIIHSVQCILINRTQCVRLFIPKQIDCLLV